MEEKSPEVAPLETIPKTEAVFEESTQGNSELYERFVSIVTSLEEVGSICDLAWNHFDKGSEQCSLEGRSESWMACAIYSSLTLQQQIGQPTNYKCSLTQILTACDISPLEFFDKMNRWKEVMSSPRRVFDQMCRMQSSLSVSAVVFKRFLPIMRSVFNQPDHVEGHEASANNEFLNIVKAIWISFLIMKKQYMSNTSEDLISAFHLLLCIMEHFLKDITASAPHFVHSQILAMDPDTDLLELMCTQFNGIVLDGKHLRVHWFQESVQNILKLKDPINLMENMEEYLMGWFTEYELRLKKRGELNEMMFIPSDYHYLFHPDFEVGVVDELRRSLGQSHQLMDASFLIRMSTQGCLNRLAEKSSTPTTLTVNTEQSSPTSNLSRSEYKMMRLSTLIPSELSMGSVGMGPELEMLLLEARDSPINYIKETLSCQVERLEKVLSDEEEEFPDRDGGLSTIRSHIGNISSHLFYRLLEKISQVERERTKDIDFVGMFRKDEFIISLFVISVEIILDAYNSERIFPWSIQVFKLPPISFYKIIELVVKADIGLSRDSIRHINGIEENILEEMAWTHDSPLWGTLSRRADGVPSSESIWTYESERRLVTSYSPVKKRRTEDGRIIDCRLNGLTPGTLFFRKIYLMAAARLNDLCDRLKMDEKGKEKVWTIFEHTLRTETNLYAGRHLDQNLLCIVYVMVRICKLEWSFQDIMCKYREQPQATARVYREVLVVPGELPPEFVIDDESIANGAVIDLIKYYNNVFITRVEDLVRRMEGNDSGLVLIPIPSLPLHMSSPVKKMICERILVTPLFNRSSSPVNPSVRTMKYNLNKSPQDLKIINKVVHRASVNTGIMSNRQYPQIAYRY
ncbi:lin-35 [Pristionchus pacificus]|uniref:Lin-35 n=1 Tax=Pristionchus pacificus TaxID=54126 RepID=A0A2A6BDF0_PRIPA|nr:lin-35 [Pristionchus pacificus]|eukprot:PDM63907.1 lin-35 [Pristionchus pacificus]